MPGAGGVGVDADGGGAAGGVSAIPGERCAEVKTPLPMVEELRSRYEGERPVVAGDAGLLGRENPEARDRAGFEWVVAARLRKLREVDSAALSEKAEGWSAYAGDAADRAEPGGRGPQIREHRLLEGALRGRRPVATCSPLRARRPAPRREEAVERARRKSKGTWWGGAGPIAAGGRNGGPGPSLRKAEKRDARYDGLPGVLTRLEAPTERVRARYSRLREIEHGFPVLKHPPAGRPRFPRTERRVRAHLAVRSPAFALLRLFRHRCRPAPPGRPVPSEERRLEEPGGAQSSPGATRGANGTSPRRGRSPPNHGASTPRSG